MNVDASDNPKTTKHVHALILLGNLAILLVVRKSCADLVTRHAWTWDPNRAETRTIEIKSTTNANVTEEAMFQTAFAFRVRQKTMLMSLCNLNFFA